MSYTFLEHTADVLFEAHGKDLKELFESCASAVSETMIENFKEINEEKTFEIVLQNEDVGKLLHEFLQELLYYKDAELMVFGNVDVKVEHIKGVYILHAALLGEQINYDRHKIGVNVKAVTFHEYRVWEDEGWHARVLLDV